MSAELVPLEHDLLYYLKYDEEADREKQCEAFREHFKRYCELVKELKNENLIHQSYIPQEVFNAYTSVVKQMQDDIHAPEATVGTWYILMNTLLDANL